MSFALEGKRTCEKRGGGGRVCKAVTPSKDQLRAAHLVMHLWLMWGQQRRDSVMETKIQSVPGTEEKTKVLVRSPLLYILWSFGKSWTFYQLHRGLKGTLTGF